MLLRLNPSLPFRRYHGSDFSYNYHKDLPINSEGFFFLGQKRVRLQSVVVSRLHCTTVSLLQPRHVVVYQTFLNFTFVIKKYPPQRIFLTTFNEKSTFCTDKIRENFIYINFTYYCSHNTSSHAKYFHEKM